MPNWRQTKTKCQFDVNLKTKTTCKQNYTRAINSRKCSRATAAYPTYSYALSDARRRASNADSRGVILLSPLEPRPQQRSTLNREPRSNRGNNSDHGERLHFDGGQLPRTLGSRARACVFRMARGIAGEGVHCRHLLAARIAKKKTRPTKRVRPARSVGTTLTSGNTSSGNSQCRCAFLTTTREVAGARRWRYEAAVARDQEPPINHFSARRTTTLKEADNYCVGDNHT